MVQLEKNNNSEQFELMKTAEVILISFASGY